MNAFLLVIPVFLLRYGLMGLMDRSALRRAAFFPQMQGIERAAYWVYQVSTAILVLYPLFLRIRTDSGWFGWGLAAYCLGIVLYAVSIANFARPSADGINARGLYRVSRNPMYVSLFICFLGCALLARSWILLAALTIYKASEHWIILSEERWCIREFGNGYSDYMKKVRRYL